MAVLLLIGLAALVVFTVMLVRGEQASPETEGAVPPDPVSNDPAAFGQASLVPPGDARPGGLLVFTTRSDGSGAALNYLSGDPLAVQWQSAELPLADESTPIPPALAADTVYLANGAELQALDLADGARRWSADLGAAVPAGCASCVQPLEGAVAVLTEDQTLHAFAAEDGEPLWQVALHTLPRELYRIDKAPAVIDSLPDTESSALLVFDPATGTERARFEPRCETNGVAETLNPGSPVLVDSASGALTFLFGFAQRGCAQRWDIATGAIIWSTSVPLERSGWPRTWMAAGPLPAEDAIYFAGAEGAAILALSAGDGALHTLVRSEAYTLKPWALADKTLLVRAERLDGPEEDELWGIALPGGERLWTYPITRDNSSWAADRAPGGFVVIQLAPDPPRLRVTLLDAREGTPLRRRALSVDSAAWTGTTWDEASAWLTIGALYRVDLNTGLTTQVWPAR